MALTFANVKAEVASRVRLDTSQTAQSDLIERWVNQALHDVHGRYDWPWTIDREVVQTVVDKTAGTAAVSVAGTTVTGTSTAFAAADVGKFIQFSSNSDWYKITAVASTTSLTIEKGFTGTSAATADTMTIRQIFYSLSSNAEKVLGMRQSRSPSPITHVPWQEWARSRPDMGGSATGKGVVYAPFGQDSSGNIHFSLYPHPDAVYNVEVAIKHKAIGKNAAGTKLTTLSTGTDTLLIPDKHQQAIINGALTYAYGYIGKATDNDNRQERAEGLYERQIQRMIAESEEASDMHTILSTREAYNTPVGPSLPEDFDVRSR